MRRLLLLVFLAACNRSTQSPIHFCREEVSLQVRPGMLRVSANYHFRNLTRGPVAALILYPFPLDSTHAWPDSIVIPGHAFQFADSGVSFLMRLRPNAEDSFRVFYRQPLRGSSARYIVTSTKKWQRPIDLAQFTVSIPADLPGVQINYQPDSIGRTDSTLVLGFSRRRFYPDEDVVVTWSAR